MPTVSNYWKKRMECKINQQSTSRRHKLLLRPTSNKTPARDSPNPRKRIRTFRKHMTRRGVTRNKQTDSHNTTNGFIGKGVGGSKGQAKFYYKKPFHCRDACSNHRRTYFLLCPTTCSKIQICPTGLSFVWLPPAPIDR